MKIAEPGKLIFTAPKARHDYYNPENHDRSHGGNPNAAQRLWFEYMKQGSREIILRGTAKIVGGKAQK